MAITLFGIFINLIETFLFFHLLSNKLILKENHFLITCCMIIQFTLITVLNLLPVNSIFRIIIILLLQIGIAFIISLSRPSQTLFWGSMYMIIVIFSDSATFLFGALLTNYSASDRLYKPPMNIIMTLLYLFICFTCVFLLTRKRGQNFTFPWYFFLMLAIIILLGIAAVELLLELLLLMDNNSVLIERILFFSISVIFLILIFTIVSIRCIGNLYQKNLALTEENRQKQFEQQQFELLNNTNQILRSWKHDFQNHLTTIQIMMENQKYQETQAYLNTISQDLNKSSWQVRTGNSIIDAVLTSKLPRIQDGNIEFIHSIFLPDRLPLGSIELTSLLGNLMDNAIDACEQIPENNDADTAQEKRKRYIHLEIKPYNQNLFLDITNSSSGKYRYNISHTLISTKKGFGHGIGLKRIEQMVSEADGFLQITPETDSFHVNILMPLPDEISPKGETI